MTQPGSSARGPALGHTVRGAAPGLAPRPLVPRPPLARSLPVGGGRGQPSACSGLGGGVLGTPASSWEQPSCPPKPRAQATLGAPAASPPTALTEAPSHVLLAQASAGFSGGRHPQRGLAQGSIPPSAGQLAHFRVTVSSD